MQTHPRSEDDHCRVLLEQDILYFLENNSESINLKLKSKNLGIDFHNFFEDREDLDGVDPALGDSSYRTDRVERKRALSLVAKIPYDLVSVLLLFS